MVLASRTTPDGGEDDAARVGIAPGVISKVADIDVCHAAHAHEALRPMLSAVARSKIEASGAPDRPLNATRPAPERTAVNVLLAYGGGLCVAETVVPEDADDILLRGLSTLYSRIAHSRPASSRP